MKNNNNINLLIKELTDMSLEESSLSEWFKNELISNNEYIIAWDLGYIIKKSLKKVGYYELNLVHLGESPHFKTFAYAKTESALIAIWERIKKFGRETSF